MGSLEAGVRKAEKPRGCILTAGSQKRNYPECSGLCTHRLTSTHGTRRNIIAQNLLFFKDFFLQGPSLKSLLNFVVVK